MKEEEEVPYTNFEIDESKMKPKKITDEQLMKFKQKHEINNIYNCSFPNCDKSYPTKCSLNMHIKLKHHHLINDENNK